MKSLIDVLSGRNIRLAGFESFDALRIQALSQGAGATCEDSACPFDITILKATGEV